MHLLDSFSFSCGGIKATRPNVYTKYTPTPEKYILFAPASDCNSAYYDYYQDVLAEISGILESKNYKIIQTGSKNEKKYGLEHYDVGFNELAYICKNARGYFGANNLAAQLCAAENIPTVVLMGHVKAENYGPVFGKKIKVLEPKNEPTYNPNEWPKNINKIKPEEVSNAILQFLGFSEKVRYNTVFVGERYNEMTADVIPNFMPPKGFLTGAPLNIRCDLIGKNGHYDDKNIIGFAQEHDLHLIIKDSQINLDMLKMLKNRIHAISYIMDKRILSQKEVAIISSVVKNLALFVENKNEDEIGDIRADLFPHIVRFREKNSVDSKKVLDIKSKIGIVDEQNQKFKVKTHKFYYAAKDNQVFMFASLAHFRRGEFVQNHNDIVEFYDEDWFWENVDYYKIVKEKQ